MFQSVTSIIVGTFLYTDTFIYTSFIIYLLFFVNFTCIPGKYTIKLKYNISYLNLLTVTYV